MVPTQTMKPHRRHVNLKTMESPASEKFSPAWGIDNWPRRVGELDEGDLLLIDSMLELSPLERLNHLEQFVNGLDQLKLVRIRTG